MTDRRKATMLKPPPSLAGHRLKMLETAALPTSSPARLPAKDYNHYQHSDDCRFSRWTARECYQFMYARPWEKVNHFYLELVQGRRALSELFRKEVNAVHDVDEIAEVFDNCHLLNMPKPSEVRTGRWARVTFKIILSYHGYSFDGWQKQPGLNTVQGLIEKALGSFVDEKKALQLKEKKLPREGCAVVAGRTDKGVSALGQVCSFYTWRKDVKAEDIMNAINNSTPGKLTVTSVSQVSREFHPNFSAKWRRYLYMFPLNDGLGDCKADHFQFEKNAFEGGTSEDDQPDENSGENDPQTDSKPLKFEVSRVNQLLLQLEGKLLSFRMFARDTKASRSSGPATECFIFHARAAEAFLPCPEICRHGLPLLLPIVDGPVRLWPTPAWPKPKKRRNTALPPALTLSTKLSPLAQHKSPATRPEGRQRTRSRKEGSSRVECFRVFVAFVGFILLG